MILYLHIVQDLFSCASFTIAWFVDLSLNKYLEQKKFISLKSLLTPSLKTSDLILGYNSISKASNYYLYDLDVVLLYILMQTKTCCHYICVASPQKQK